MSSDYEKINLLTKLRMEAWRKGNKYDDKNNYKKANEELSLLQKNALMLGKIKF